MSRLDDLIAEYCPDGVEYKRLELCCNILDNKRKPVTKAAREAGEYPYYGANGIQDYVSDYIFDGTYVLVGEDGSVVTPNGNPVVNWAQGKIWVNNHAHIIEEKEGTLLRYLFHYLQIINVAPLIHGNIPKLTGGDFRALSIPVPPLPVQREIVRILDNFTERVKVLQEQLTAELTARKKQYEYYKEAILTLSAYPYYSLNELCDIVDYRGKTPKKADSGAFLVTAKNIRQGYIDYEKSKEYISEKDYADVMHRGVPKIGDVLITTEAPCGYVAQVDREHIALAQRVIKYRPKSNNLDSTFLKHVLLGKEFQDKLNAAATGGTVKGIKGSKLHQLTIPLPPLDLQKQIVDVLDKFDSLCTNISLGLPAEIEARQKQYEYYRDKLLTFKEKD